MHRKAISAHSVHLELWGIAPSPVVYGQDFAVTIGAKCTCGCHLGDSIIHLAGADGTVLVSAQLGSDPWPGTIALFWTRLAIPSPQAVGRHAYLATFEPPGHVHTRTTKPLGFLAIGAPVHQVSVRVTHEVTQLPLTRMSVRLGGHRGLTDRAGVARFSIAAGGYEASASGAGYRASSQQIDIRGDNAVELFASEVQLDDAYEDWC